MTTIGDNVLFYRIQKDWSQETLADKVGVSRESISLYENGHNIPLPRTQKKLAEALGITEKMLTSERQEVPAKEEMSTLARSVIDSVREMIALYEREARR